MQPQRICHMITKSWLTILILLVCCILLSYFTVHFNKVSPKPGTIIEFPSYFQFVHISKIILFNLCAAAAWILLGISLFLDISPKIGNRSTLFCVTCRTLGIFSICGAIYFFTYLILLIVSLSFIV